MKSATPSVLIWLALLSVLVAGAWFAVTHTTRQWSERDIDLRTELAVSSARRALLSALRGQDTQDLQLLLGDLITDERIMAAAVCGADGQSLAASAGYPSMFSCPSLLAHVRSAAMSGNKPWRENVQLQQSMVYLAAIPLLEQGELRGFVVLVHDLSFISRRERSAQLFLLLAFVVLALGSATVTLVSSRLLWQAWNRSLRRIAKGETQEVDKRPEFQPLLKDLRDLLDRLAQEEQAEQHGGIWNPERLKLTLRRHLHGERIIVLANREPYIHQHDDEGGIRVVHPASGLVSALEPVMRACSGVWVAHGAGDADRQTVDAQDHVRVPPGEESYLLRRLWLSEEQERGYYYGFANEGLWPLCHVAHARPTFRAEDWQQYQQVNQKFADAVCQEASSEDPVILVQDYHFALAPRMLRARLPRATIITFWHIPWPNVEQISICPWHRALVEGLLGSSILGFHTQQHCNNFMEAADHFIESRLDREDFAVIRRGQRTLVRAYPISVEWPHHHASEAPPPAQCRAELLAQLQLPPDTLLGIGIDRLDYTKGIEERFRAVERLLEREAALIGRFVFLQIASPSRTQIERYQQVNRDVEDLAARINARFGREGWQPILLRRRHTEPADVFRLYRAAQLCYVSSLHDGMNLVAKEYVAAHDDELGVLVLSQFTGASRELREALIVNPYDIEAASGALAQALLMPAEEQTARMRAMRRAISEANVYRWAGRMLIDASRLRRREQLIELLTDQHDYPLARSA